MEIAFLVLAVLSGLTGFLLRRVVAPSVRRLALGLGVATSVVAFCVLALPFIGFWPFDAIVAGLVAAILLVIALLTLPFALALSWPGRSGA